MKRIISLVLCVLSVGFSLALPVFAAEDEKEFFEDGSYLVVSYDSPIADENTGDDIGSEGSPVSPEEDTISFLSRLIELIKKIINFILGKNTPEETERKEHTVGMTKYARYYSSDGDLLWYVCLRGSFAFDGEKSLCTDASVSSNIADSDWTLISSHAEKSGNTAKGEFEMKQYKLGVPLKTIEKTLTLTCDGKGKIE